MPSHAQRAPPLGKNHLMQSLFDIAYILDSARRIAYIVYAQLICVCDVDIPTCKAYQCGRISGSISAIKQDGG